MPRTSEMPSRRPGGRPPVKTRRLAAAVGAATLGGCVVAVATGAAPVEPSIRGLLRAHGVAVEAINLSADGIVARHLSTQADSWRVDVADVKTPVPGTSGATTADDIVVTTPQEVYRVKHIELAGSALSSADLAALFDPKNATPIGERLSRLTADQVRIPEVSADETAGEIKTRRTYRDVVLTNVASGRIATASVGGVSLTQTDAAGTMVMQTTYGAILAHGVDAPLIARIESEARTDRDEPKAKLFDDLTVDGMRQFWPKTQIEGSAGRLQIVGPRMRRLAAPVPMPDLGASDATPRQRQQRFAQIAVTVLDAVEFGRIDIDDIRVRDLTGATQTEVTIGRSHIDQPGPDSILATSFEGLKTIGRTGTYQIARIDAANLDLASLRGALHAIADGANTSDLVVRRNLTPIMDKLTLQALDADVVDQSRQHFDAPADRMRFHIDGVEVAEGKPTNGIPSTFHAKLDHLTFGVPASETFKPLAEMGYSKLDLSSRFGFAWNEGAKELSVDDIWLNGVGMGALRLTAGFSNVSNDLFSTDGAVVQAAAFGMFLKKLDLRLDNAGLIEKMMARQAADDGQSLDDVRQGYVSAAGVGIPVLLGNGAAAKAIGAAAAKFVAKPKNFHLAATSSAGIAASDMQFLSTPDVLMSKLQVQVNANE